METYNCRVCGYSKRCEKAPRSCPYCGKDGVMVMEKSAEEMLDEV